MLDNSSSTFLIAAQPSGSALQLYTLRDSSTAGITLTGPVDVAVDPYDMPPPAPQPQPCTDPADNLDTSDSRFVNASTQVGDALWQVHTISLGGAPTPRYYQVNTATHTVDQSGVFFATGTSSDFNASVAANSDNDVFVTWTSTDAAAGTNAQVRFAGCDHATGPCGFLGSGSALVTSPTCVAGDFDPNFGLQTMGRLLGDHRRPDQLETGLVGEREGQRLGHVGQPHRRTQLLTAKGARSLPRPRVDAERVRPTTDRGCYLMPLS